MNNCWTGLNVVKYICWLKLFTEYHVQIILGVKLCTSWLPLVHTSKFKTFDMGQMTHFLFSSCIRIILRIVFYIIMNLSFIFSQYPAIDAGLLNIPVSNLISYIICEERMQKGYTTSLEKKYAWETQMNTYEKFFTILSQFRSKSDLCLCFWWCSPALKDSTFHWAEYRFLLEGALKVSTTGMGKVHSPGGGCEEPGSSNCPNGFGPG